jgi:type IV secretory pathway TrbL component
LEEGAYSKRIQQSCNVLSDIINTTGETVAKAKVEVDKTMDNVRQYIHEATAPKTGSAGKAQASSNASGASGASPGRSKTAARAGTSRRQGRGK